MARPARPRAIPLSGMVKVHQALAGRDAFLVMQVHDELVFEVAPGESDVLEEVVRAGMANAADLMVPLDVQIGRGANWDDAAH